MLRILGSKAFWFPRERLVTWWRRWSKEGRLSLRTSRRSRREHAVGKALAKAAIAETEGDAEKMRSSSYKLLSLELYERAWEVRVRAARLKQQSCIPEWEGGDLSGRSILVRAYAPKDRIGEELRLARFIAPVAQRARRCIVLAEPRLVPLLRRSFPGVDVRPRGTDDAAAFAEADVAAYYETIAFHYAKNAEEMRRSFVPLRADPTLVGSIRQSYKLRSRGPLLGISWGSSNESKVLPDLESWAPLLGWPSVNFVSLQYGHIKRDLEVLQRLAYGHVIHDTGVDPLVDLDSFAAQIAALDAVVSISNTTIDMAGMLGARTLHVRDDKSSAIWPQSGPSPWYPGMIMLYRERRPWSEVLAEARTRLEQMISTGR
jgi:hypothetical protein